MKTVSYSQFSLYNQCPQRWKLDYIDGLRTYDVNIHVTFGSAFHKTVQDYVHELLTVSVKSAESMDLHGMLKDNLYNEYKGSLDKNGNQHYSTAQELSEFYMDGVAILDYFKKNRTTYFNTKNDELVGIEKPLRVELTSGVTFIGFIDIVIKNKITNTYTIYDIKTSTMGWNKHQKADISKTAQLVLYKEFYAKQFNVDPDSINVEYIIVRRKINEDLEFVPKRIQSFSPASGKPTRNKVGKLFQSFINEAFNEDGSYKVENNYPAYKGKACTYCPYNADLVACPKQNRLIKDEES